MWKELVTEMTLFCKAKSERGQSIGNLVFRQKCIDLIPLVALLQSQQRDEERQTLRGRAHWEEGLHNETHLENQTNIVETKLTTATSLTLTGIFAVMVGE